MPQFIKCNFCFLTHFSVSYIYLQSCGFSSLLQSTQAVQTPSARLGHKNYNNYVKYITSDFGHNEWPWSRHSNFWSELRLNQTSSEYVHRIFQIYSRIEIPTEKYCFKMFYKLWNNFLANTVQCVLTSAPASHFVSQFQWQFNFQRPV